MPFSTNGKNVMLNALRDVAVYASLHTGNPGDSGASEVTGGLYTRVACTFGESTVGSVSASGISFNVPADTTITHVGFWSAASGGTFLGYDDIDPEEFNNAGTYVVGTATMSIS